MFCGRTRSFSGSGKICDPLPSSGGQAEGRSYKDSSHNDQKGRTSGFAPSEFVAENFEVGFVGRLDELEALGGTGDAHIIAALHRHAGLAIKREENGIRAFRETQLYL